MDITDGERELARKWYEGPGGAGAAVVERMAADFAAERLRHVQPYLERIQVLETERAGLVTERDAYKAEIARLQAEVDSLQERSVKLGTALQQVLDKVQTKLKWGDHGIGAIVRVALGSTSKEKEPAISPQPRKRAKSVP